MTQNRGEHSKYFLAGLVAVATFLVYLRTLHNGFVNWDDDRYVYENFYIRSFNGAFLKWAFSFYFVNWHPLTWISHALDYAIWGLNPMGHHLTSIILHSINTFVVVLLAVKLLEIWEETHPLIPSQEGTLNFSPLGRGQGVGTGKLIAGLTVGLLFGLHPLHVESVAWASERKDVLCALFFMLSILVYIKYAARLHIKYAARQGSRFFDGKYFLPLILFAFALMSKPMAVTLPLVLLILDWHPLGRIFSFKSFRSAFAEKNPFFALSAGAAVLTVMAQNKEGAIKSLKFAPFHTRLFVAARAIALYLSKMALPLHLSPYYPYPYKAIFLSEFFLPVFLVCFLTIVVFYMAVAKGQKIWLACWGYFIITLLPVIGLMQVGKQAMADRYTYLPSLGPFLVFGIASAWVWEKTGSFKWERVLKVTAAAAAFFAVLSMSYLSYRQIGIWKNGLVFWNNVIETQPYKVPLAYYGRASAYEQANQTGRAIADYNEAIALDPGFADAYNNLGLIFEGQGQSEKAIAYFRKAIAVAPSYDVPYNNLGITYENQDKLDLALDAFNKAVHLNQDDGSQAYFNRGNIYMDTGRKELAARDFRKACAMGDKDACAALRDFSGKNLSKPSF